MFKIISAVLMIKMDYLTKVPYEIHMVFAVLSGLIGAGVSKLWSSNQSCPADCFCNTARPLLKHIVYGCFHDQDRVE